MNVNQWQSWKPTPGVLGKPTCGNCKLVVRDESAMWRGTKSHFKCSVLMRDVRVRELYPEWCPGAEWHETPA